MWPSQPTAKSLIRAHLPHTSTAPEWGFVIFNCTSTQNRAAFNTLLTHLQSLTTASLSSPQDGDLLSTLTWTVFSYPGLKGLSWKQARPHFDAWVSSQLDDRKVENTSSRPWEEQTAQGFAWTEAMKKKNRVGREPRLGFCIVVDDESLWSVLAGAQGGGNGGWVRVVKTSLGGEDTSDYPEGWQPDEEEEPEEDEYNEDYWRDFRQRFKASELVKVYASILHGDWPDGFETDGEGVAEIVQF